MATLAGRSNYITMFPRLLELFVYEINFYSSMNNQRTAEYVVNIEIAFVSIILMVARQYLLVSL